jgi:hypothetical protein
MASEPSFVMPSRTSRAAPPFHLDRILPGKVDGGDSAAKSSLIDEFVDRYPDRAVYIGQFADLVWDTILRNEPRDELAGLVRPS